MVALGALVADENEIYDLTNIGTLSAFAIVCIGVLVLRVQGARPPASVPRALRLARLARRSRRLPVHHVGAARRRAWERFGWWLAIGLALYFAYGYPQFGAAPRAPRQHSSPRLIR